MLPQIVTHMMDNFTNSVLSSKEGTKIKKEKVTVTLPAIPVILNKVENLK